MEDFSQISNFIFHLSRLALIGDEKDVQIFLNRQQHKLQNQFPDLANDLKKMLRDVPTKSKPFRNSNISTVPVDRDSRLQLLRQEIPPIDLEVDPIWEGDVNYKLQQIVFEYKNPKALKEAELDPTKTVIFSGPPGVGKTFAAKWLANKLKLPLLTLDLSAVMSSFLGRTGNNVRNVFDYAKGMECILLLDELDTIAKKRDDNTEIGELKRLVTVLLQELDNWTVGSIVIAATNHPGLLDPAVWRRFDMNIEFPMPSTKVIPEVLKSYLGPAYNETKDIHKLLGYVLQGKSYSDMRKELVLLRRNAVVTKRKVPDVFEEWLQSTISSVTHKERINIAIELAKNHELSQRKVSEITGVSRDTIRAKGGKNG